MNKGMYTSDKDDWTTPRDLFNFLNNRFSFTLDPCSTHENALCDTFFTKTTCGLDQSWKGHRVFMNPPYGREIKKWVQKAWSEAQDNNALVVGLLPARTDTEWWNLYVDGHADIHFIAGRLKFSGAKNSAPFPSAIVVWYGQPIIKYQNFNDVENEE